MGKIKEQNNLQTEVGIPTPTYHYNEVFVLYKVVYKVIKLYLEMIIPGQQQSDYSLYFIC